MYTDQQILDRLHEHLIDNKGSVWTMHKPSWQGVQKRMLKDEEFEEKVRDIVAYSNYLWEKVGIDALLADGGQGFNVGLYTLMVRNKKAFLPYEVIELEERLKRIEDAQTDKTY